MSLPARCRGVVILGNSRSGTSMVARAFDRSGFHLGRAERLMAGNAANPVGFFENLDVYAINEEILAALDGSWYCPPPADRQRAAAGRFAPRLRELLDGLLTQAGSAPIAVKDPRIGALLPIWQPVFDGLLHPLLAVRHPLEIARSLQARDDTAVPLALAAWEVHTCGLLDALAGREATVVAHARALAEPQLASEAVAHARERLDPETAAHVDPAAAHAAVEPSLRNCVADRDEPGAHLTPHQEGLWSWLAGLGCGDARIDPPAELREPSAAALELVRHQACDEHARRRAAAALALAERRRMVLDARVEVLRIDTRRLTNRAYELEAELERIVGLYLASEAALRGAEQALAVTRRSLSWRVTAPLRSIKRGGHVLTAPRRQRGPRAAMDATPPGDADC